MTEERPTAPEPVEPARGEPLLRAEGLSKTYRRGGAEVAALAGVDLEIAAGTTVALVGASGGGKSTLGRCLALLEEPTSGEVWFEGRRLSIVDRRQRRRLRPRIQLIFQDPAAALNPRFSVLEAVMEPLAVGRWDRRQRCERALELLSEVALPAELAGRSTGELSGGQRQRLVIARALAADPRVLILDEALASLDLSLQAQITNLLVALQDRRGLTYLLISHDLRLAAHLADEIAVLDRGRVVERALPAELLARPRHDAARALVASLPGAAR